VHLHENLANKVLARSQISLAARMPCLNSPRERLQWPPMVPLRPQLTVARESWKNVGCGMVLSRSLGFAVATRLELVLRERAASGPSRRLRSRGLSELPCRAGSIRDTGNARQAVAYWGCFLDVTGSMKPKIRQHGAALFASFK
jgi:hypothetical protein